MVSTWQSKYLVENLSEDFDEHFKTKSETPLINYYKGLVDSVGQTASYDASVACVTAAWEHCAGEEHRAGQDLEHVALMVECLARATPHLLLAGDWATADPATRTRLETAVRRCGTFGVGRKESVEAVLSLAAKPWDRPRVKSLLTGKSELQQQVLSLVSTEGVDTVLLRAELLVEAGLDKPAYKLVSNVVSSLLADHIVFESYVVTSRPGALQRLVDTFLALAAATHRLARLYRVLRLLGLEEVNTVYLPRFLHYSKAEAFKKNRVMEEDVEKLLDADDAKLCPDPGRCGRLFTPLVCSRVLKIIWQWSLAGAGVRECPPDLQLAIIQRWLQSMAAGGLNLANIIPDVETVTKTANQTSFLYNLGITLWRKYGKDVETISLQMFIKGLTSDINRLETFKKNRTKKEEVEKRLANAFLLLSEIVGDRVSLAREAVLTGFSILPTSGMLEKIKEFAKVSGLDKLAEENKDEVDVEEVIKFSRSRPIHNLQAAREAHNTEYKSAESLLSSLDSRLNLQEIFENFTGKLGAEKYGKAERKLRSKETKKKKFRNLEGLLSIQGELITEAENYNPLDTPCKSLTPEALQLSKQITDDLLIVISAPRWHLLSWVMDWKELNAKCIQLLENPSLRIPNEELKYLNIDYTQFDEWSSDEEITIFTGIEKGYEKWLEVDQGDDKFSEHGLTSEDEEVVFNTKHTIDKLDYDDHDHFITDNDYKLKMDKDDVEMIDGNEGKPAGAAMDVEDEITDEPDDAIKTESKIEPEPEKLGAKCEERMEVNFAMIRSGSPALSVAQLRARLLLSRLVPGLEGSAVLPRPEQTVMMVQISPATTSTATTPPPAPPSTAPALVLRPGPSSLAPGTAVSVARPGQTTIRLSPVTSPRVAASSPGPGAASPAKKVQYICKQGGNTFLIESSAVLDKLRQGGLQLRLPSSPAPATKTELGEGLAGRLGSLLPAVSGPGSTVAVRQAAVVSAGLTSTSPKPSPAPATSTIVVTRPPAAPDKLDPAGSNNNTSSSPADLIRQLNLARAQGLVVLQQWGDKQVLVHKATGRWIMRQGSRLVTVPPQALGITVTEDGATTPTSSPAISSRTMEQLAEFDSILESKFKTENGAEFNNGGVVVVSGSGSTKQIIQLPTTPLKKELVLGTKDGIKSNQTSPIKSPPTLPNANTSYPKPQEDPETMKRIQAILDDYNDQIRNSPDLHNRPAPRRRTNGSGNPDSPKPDSPRSSSGSASGSTSPNNRRCGSESLSPSPSLSPVKSDPLVVAMAEIKESGALTLTAKAAPSSLASAPAPQLAPAPSTVRLVPKLVGGPGAGPQQRLVVPAGTVQRLVVVSSSDGRRMVAVRPVAVSTNTFTNTISTNNLTLNPRVPVTVSLPTSPVSLSALTSLISRPGPSSPPRPPTPVADLGIPMEMTPGQIMEAEISATLLDNPESPFQSGSLIHEADPDTSLHDHVFSVSSPGPSLDTDFDQVIQTTDSSSHLSELESNDLELPVSTIIVSSSDTSANLTSSDTASSLNTNTIKVTAKRRRSDRIEENQPERKSMRLDSS